MLKLKRIGVLSVAKFQAVFMALFGLVFGIFYAILGAALASLFGAESLGAGIAIFAVIGFPILFAIAGFVSGAFAAWMFNLVVGWIGGIEMEFGE